MSVRTETNKYGHEVIVVDRRWPDGKRYRREMPNRTVAKELDDRIAAAFILGTWKDLRDELVYGIRQDWNVRDYSDHYFETYCEVHNKPSSCQRKRTSLSFIAEFLGDKTLRDVQMRDVHAYVAWRKRMDVKPATVNRDLGGFRHMFEFAVDEGSLKMNAIARIKKLKERRAERPRVSETTYLRIRKHLPFPVQQIVSFIWETGCRPSEALALEWDQVDLERLTAVFNLRKAGDNALVALTSRAVEAILEVPKLPGCPYVFWNSQTRTRYQRINETFRRAREKAGHPEVQLKDFRREAGIVIAESGQPLHVAQTQLGHSSIKTTEKYYAHFSPEFAVNRAREALENRDPDGRPDGRQTGGQSPDEPCSENPSKKESSNVLDFQRFREGFGGGERIRTAE